MKILNINEIKSISGGTSLVITQQISTEGLSAQCVEILANILQHELTDDEMASYVLSGCTLPELDILDDRLDAAAITKLELIK